MCLQSPYRVRRVLWGEESCPTSNGNAWSCCCRPRSLPAGSQVAIISGAGNRDERHYDNPDAFLVERNPIDHLSFGHGRHRLKADQAWRRVGRLAGRVVLSPGDTSAGGKIRRRCADEARGLSGEVLSLRETAAT